MRIPTNVCLPCATLLFALLLMSLASKASASVLADLATDWSNTNNPNTSNPNGTWEYRQGTSDLHLISP
jgi:hypothetical protein